MRQIHSVVVAFILALPFCCAYSLPAGRPAAAAKNSVDVSINGDNPWVDTGMDVNAGENCTSPQPGQSISKTRPEWVPQARNVAGLTRFGR